MIKELVTEWWFWYLIGGIATVMRMYLYFDDIESGGEYREKPVLAYTLITVVGAFVWPIFWMLVIIGEVKAYVDS